jgi:hypothetical protein
MAPIEASRNQGNSSNGRKNSPASASNQIPWVEIFVTSTPEEDFPCGLELILMHLNDGSNLC